jgi:hypothetical protein
LILFNFSNFSFLDTYYEQQHIHFLVHGHPIWSTFNLHLLRGQRLCKLSFYKIKPWMLGHQIGL